MSIGKRFLASVLASGSASTLLQYGQINHLFRPTEIAVYDFVRGFLKQYQALPTEETIEAHTGEVLPPGEEPPDYYYDLMVQRHVEFQLKDGMKKASAFLAPDNKDPNKALEELAGAVMSLVMSQHQRSLLDFRDAYDLIMGEYAKKMAHGDDYGLMLGWPTLDDMSGGLLVGDKISFVGRPAQGKTFQMLWGALHGWNRAEEMVKAAASAAGSDQQTEPVKPVSRLFVSMEMGQLAIQQRMAAMEAHVPMAGLKLAELQTAGFKKLKNGLTEIKSFHAPFWVMDANLAATVEDVWAVARQLNPDAIFIDGAYLLKHPTERDRFKRAAENAELIKKELTPIAPVCASWQFARTASKGKKKGEKATMDDIGYTDAIAQISTLALGLFQEESVETMVRRRIEILKGRNGEVGGFDTNWDFNKMDFSEIEEEEVGDLQFV